MLAQILIELGKVAEWQAGTGDRLLDAPTLFDAAWAIWGDHIDSTEGAADEYDCFKAGWQMALKGDTEISAYQLAGYVTYAIMEMITKTGDISEVGNLLTDRTRDHVRYMVQTKVESHRLSAAKIAADRHPAVGVANTSVE